MLGKVEDRLCLAGGDGSGFLPAVAEGGRGSRETLALGSSGRWGQRPEDVPLSGGHGVPPSNPSVKMPSPLAPRSRSRHQVFSVPGRNEPRPSVIVKVQSPAADCPANGALSGLSGW